MGDSGVEARHRAKVYCLNEDGQWDDRGRGNQFNYLVRESNVHKLANFSAADARRSGIGIGMVGYAGADSRRRRRDAIFCVAITGCVVLMMLLALRPMLGLFLLSLGGGAVLLPRKHWTRERLALACCTCGACLLCGGLGYRHYLRMPAPALPPLPSQPDEAPAPPRPPAQPTALSSCSFLRHRAYTTACAQHGYSRAACSRRYVRVREAGVELTSMCMYNWQEGTCVTAEARYECRKLGLSSGFAWNLLRALLLLLGLTIGLPVLLPWVQRQLPSYGLMSEAQYEAQCALTRTLTLPLPLTLTQTLTQTLTLTRRRRSQFHAVSTLTLTLTPTLTLTLTRRSVSARRSAS